MSVHVCRDFLFLNGKCDNPKKVAVPEPVDQFAQSYWYRNSQLFKGETT